VSERRSPFAAFFWRRPALFAVKSLKEAAEGAASTAHARRPAATRRIRVGVAPGTLVKLIDLRRALPLAKG